MKNLKMRTLCFGVLSTVLISSTPVFATTSTTTSASAKATLAATSTTAPTTKSSKLLGVVPDYVIDQLIANGDIIGPGYSSTGVVQQVQSHLINAGFLPNISSSKDGIYGSNTQDAVRNFQKSHGLKADGLVGPATWRILENY